MRDLSMFNDDELKAETRALHREIALVESDLADHYGEAARRKLRSLVPEVGAVFFELPRYDGEYVSVERIEAPDGTVLFGPGAREFDYDDAHKADGDLQGAYRYRHGFEPAEGGLVKFTVR